MSIVSNEPRDCGLVLDTVDTKRGTTTQDVRDKIEKEKQDAYWSPNQTEPLYRKLARARLNRFLDAERSRIHSNI